MEFANAFIMDMARFFKSSGKDCKKFYGYIILKNNNIAKKREKSIKKRMNYFTTVTVPLRLKSVPYIPVASTV